MREREQSVFGGRCYRRCPRERWQGWEVSLGHRSTLGCQGEPRPCHQRGWLGCTASWAWHTLTASLSHPNLPQQQQHSELAVCRARAIPKGLWAGAGAPTGAGSWELLHASSSHVQLSPARVFAPGSADPTCAPSWLGRSSTHFKPWAGLASSASSTEPLPPSRLPSSFLTFLAPLLKRLNSLEGFFFPPPSSCVALGVICLEYLMWSLW